jgi:hypothetical protein
VLLHAFETIVRGNRIGTDTAGLVPVPNGDRTRTKLDTLSDEDAGAREGRAIKKARRQLTGLGKTAVRQRGKKLPEAVADALAAATEALGRLGTLEAALATAAPPDSAA